MRTLHRHKKKKKTLVFTSHFTQLLLLLYFQVDGEIEIDDDCVCISIYLLCVDRYVSIRIYVGIFGCCGRQRGWGSEDLTAVMGRRERERDELVVCTAGSVNLLSWIVGERQRESAEGEERCEVRV